MLLFLLFRDTYFGDFRENKRSKLSIKFGKSGLYSSFFFLDCGITGSGVNKKHVIFFSPQWKFEVPSNL